MKKDYHYLPVRINSLWWGYGSVYLPLLALSVLSGWSALSVMKFTVWFLVICVPMFLLSYLRVYFIIKDNFLIQKFLFGGGRRVPIVNITRIVKSHFGLAHSESMECCYEKDGIEKSIVVTLFSRKPKEIVKFLGDIRSINPNIVIDPELEKSLGKRL